ncbi:MAG: alanine racemase [Clostridiales bacterium]|nr:alanine racemase [Clostridiales bacterium]
MSRYIIEKDKLQNNINIIKEKARVPIIGVVKGNGYGFGLREMALFLKENGIKIFAVTELYDIPVLKEILDGEDILVLRSTSEPDEARFIAENGCIATIGSKDACAVMDKASGQLGKKTKCHLKIDTGLGRYGFLPSEIESAKACFSSENLEFCGVYTHFSHAFCSREKTSGELAVFLDAVNQLKKSSIDPGMLHAANSPALFNCPGVSLDAVRIGSAFTGRVISSKPTGLLRTGFLQSKVIAVKKIPAGYTVGYGGTFKAKRDTTLAIVPMGHFDGFGITKAPERAALRGVLSGAKHFLQKERLTLNIDSKEYPVAGNVGLSHTAVDITGADIKPGASATADISPLYVNPNVPRVYI